MENNFQKTLKNIYGSTKEKQIPSMFSVYIRRKVRYILILQKLKHQHNHCCLKQVWICATPLFKQYCLINPLCIY